VERNDSFPLDFQQVARELATMMGDVMLEVAISRVMFRSVLSVNETVKEAEYPDDVTTGN
jgi:hypothetical protein